MAQGNSNQDNDGIAWGATALRLGSDGMDLRRPAEPTALADLINARFLDERTIQRRNGYDGQALQSGDKFPAGPNVTPGTWMYGHGQLVSSANNAFYPIALRGGATFSLGGIDVAWTGDRLLVPQNNGSPGIVTSTFWHRVYDQWAGDAATKQYPRGVPAFLPLQTDVPAPAIVTGDWVEACLTTTLRTYCCIA